MIGNPENASATLYVSAQKRKKAWIKYIGARCFDNTLYATAVNQFKIYNNNFSGGGEAAWSYTSEIKTPAINSESNITFYDFDITELRDMRNHNNKKYLSKIDRTLYIWKN